ncbi:hypothetical protein [Streptomyces phaeofaciens]|uniref:hypothetical protein n=1 Tax=Streptomyces phaeofaciens TaxID=68254 RepID=UPI0036A9842F
MHYMDRWWRPSEPGWEALDEAASAQLDLRAERYRAALTAVPAQGADAVGPQEPAAEASHASPIRPEAGTV